MLFPAGIAGGGEDDLLVIRENEPRRYIAPLRTFVAHQELGEDPAGVLAAGDSFVWNVRELVGATSGPESAYLKAQETVSGRNTWPLIASNSICLILSAFILTMKLLPQRQKEKVADAVDVTGSDKP